MRKSLEFFFDVGSPASYLAWTQLPALCASHGAELIYRPMLLGGVYQATGNASPATIPVKGRYVQMDYERHARRYGVPFKENKHFPIITLFLMRAVTGIQLRRPEQLQQLLGCVFKALWIDALNLNDGEGGRLGRVARHRVQLAEDRLHVAFELVHEFSEAP